MLYTKCKLGSPSCKLLIKIKFKIKKVYPTWLSRCTEKKRRNVVLTTF